MSGDAFARHRSLLFTVAYEMLGSASDAEDVVPETWLRWADVDHGAVRDPRAYLVRIVTRQALNQLRTLARRREDYVGEWLPEPLVTSPDVAADVELAESLSIAMLTVLETLGPPERAVFVLREVFEREVAAGKLDEGRSVGRAGTRIRTSTGTNDRRASVFSAGPSPPPANAAGWMPRETSRSSSRTRSSPEATSDRSARSSSDSVGSDEVTVCNLSARVTSCC
jgi:RNA polymerase sigma factor (sigma-70 family)